MRRSSYTKIWGEAFQAEGTAHAKSWQENNLGVYEKQKECGLARS